MVPIDRPALTRAGEGMHGPTFYEPARRRRRCGPGPVQATSPQPPAVPQATGAYFFDLYASSSRLRSGTSSTIRRPSDVSACRRPGDCGGGNEWKRDS